MNPQNKIIVTLVVVIGAAASAAYYFLFHSPTAPTAPGGKNAGGKVITENLTLPDTAAVGALEGSMVAPTPIAVPLVPKDDRERIIVPGAALTVKKAIALADPEAKKWAADAKLAFVKSLGAVTLKGESSQWQAIFDSHKLRKGYEVVMQRDAIVSQKEIVSAAAGAATPHEWRDSDYAVQTLQELPQFADASISAITFFYNTDAQEWRYGLATSEGVTSVRVR